jgi:hypothetical protein
LPERKKEHSRNAASKSGKKVVASHTVQIKEAQNEGEDDDNNREDKKTISPSSSSTF